jgi:ribosomal protein S18 acetylase RimI-like enzyme
VFAESFTALAVTHGFQGSPHIDKQNIGPFFALSVGDFADGQGGIMVECDARVVAEINTKNRLGKVDGRYPHWVAPYEKGAERYSLIFYQTEGQPVKDVGAVPGINVLQMASVKLLKMGEGHFRGLVDVFSRNECLKTLGKANGDKTMERNGELYVEGVCATEMRSWESLSSVFTQAPSEIWVLVDDDRVIGSVGVKVVDNAPSGVVALELTRMYVDKSCRRLGYGRRLMEHALSHAKQHSISEVFLTTPSVNTPAIGFYKRMGFSLENRLTVKGPDGLDLELSEMRWKDNKQVHQGAPG